MKFLGLIVFFQLSFVGATTLASGLSCLRIEGTGGCAACPGDTKVSCPCKYPFEKVQKPPIKVRTFLTPVRGGNAPSCGCKKTTSDCEVQASGGAVCTCKKDASGEGDFICTPQVITMPSPPVQTYNITCIEVCRWKILEKRVLQFGCGAKVCGQCTMPCPACDNCLLRGIPGFTDLKTNFPYNVPELEALPANFPPDSPIIGDCPDSKEVACQLNNIPPDQCAGSTYTPPNHITCPTEPNRACSDRAVCQ